MASKLVEGHEYGLSSNITCGKKTLIHFKLTDSAVRALEEYSKIKEACHQKPTLQFTKNSGAMCIPRRGSASLEDGSRGSFQLTLANIHGDANGSFDCIQQLTARQASGLHCLGSMQFKVTTHANNDVYTDTRKKIAFADNESKKICAKEIKMSSRVKGRAVKKVIPSGQYRLQASKPSPLPTPASIPALSPHQPLSGNRTSGNRTSGKSLVSSNGVMKLEAQGKGKAASGVINMSYRDRVIHLLALRSYKKPELLARLMKDGIREKDRNSLGGLLKQISVLNKDNSHSLARHAWQHVRPDWPFYTQADRALLAKNQQQQDSRASVSPSVSPAVHPANRHSPPKRGSEDSADLAPIKRQRHSQPSRQDTSPHPHPPPLSVHLLAATTASHAAPANQNTGDIADATLPEYLRQYTAIQNCGQRKRYKEDFNKLHLEYKNLLEQMETVTHKFVNLKERIFNTTEGTPEFEEVYSTVMEQYNQHRDDTQFWQSKQRLDFLHSLLGHIKRLVREFDKNRHHRECIA